MIGGNGTVAPNDITVVYKETAVAIQWSDDSTSELRKSTGSGSKCQHGAQRQPVTGLRVGVGWE